MNQEIKVLIGIGIATVLIIVGAIFFIGNKQSTPEVSETVDENLLIKNDSHKTGSASAEITLVEFGDFQCPACKAAHPTVKKLKDDYGDRMQFVYRNYPLSSIHPNAFDAALAAEAAGEQGKFFEMHDMLFANQAEWSDKKNAKDIFVSYAEKLQLNVEKFNADAKNKSLSERINSDIADGNAAGVRSTPTFFINGKRQAGGLPYDQFKTIIEAELNQN